jgi:hypothetical protein
MDTSEEFQNTAIDQNLNLSQAKAPESVPIEKTHIFRAQKT